MGLNTYNNLLYDKRGIPNPADIINQLTVTRQIILDGERCTQK